MSGAVHVAPGKVWTAGSIAFYHIVERAASYASGQDRARVEGILESLEEGLDMVSLDETDRNTFNAFHRAIRAGLDLVVRKGPSGSGLNEFFEGTTRIWAEVLTVLEADERYDASS